MSVAEIQRKSKQKGPRVISISSGKGGVGKTITTVNLAIAARRLNLDVLILDGDLGLSNVDVVLGLQSRYNINDVLDGRLSLSDIIIEGPLGIKIIPSGSGISRLAHLSYAQRLQIIDGFESLNQEFDLLLIDTGAGISENVLHFNAAANDSIIVTTPEPHAITDAYAIIKVLSENYGQKYFNLLINMTQSEAEGLKIFQRISEVAKRFLNAELNFLGHVPMDPQIQKFIAQRKAASENSTHTIAGQAWNDIARNFLTTKNATKFRPSEQVWRELIWVNQNRASQSANF